MIIDLTHTITHHMQVYPGDSPPELTQTHTIVRDGFTNHLLTTGMHVGTHIDGPWHMMDGRKTISEIPPEKLAGTACIIDISQTKEFTDTSLLRKKCANCDMVLFRSGFGKIYGSERYFQDHPVLGIATAHELSKSGIKLIGMDMPSPDQESYEIHKILLSTGILIAENLTNLEQLPAEHTFQLIVLPLKIEADSAPARVIALL